jgi:hypothetical protein
MGGRALSVPTRRYGKKEFLALKDEVVKILDKTFAFKTVPLYFREKETFGDLDVVIAWDKMGQEENREELLAHYIQDTFDPDEIFHTKNSNSWSFDYKECQVDFIMCEDDDFWCFYHYFAYNDLGNFIGVLARNVGLKYGQNGLTYDHYFKGMNVGRITVSKDYCEIFEFLGLDYTRFMRGFDNLSEIVEFVASSKYFSYDSFQLKNLNKINRERNLKRSSYMFMLDYIEEHHKTNKFTPPEDKTDLIKAADRFFPEFDYTYETRRLEYEITKELFIKSKFSTGDVIRLTNMEPEQSQEKFDLFKKHVEQYDESFWNQFILNNTKKDIENEFLRFNKMPTIKRTDN